MKNMKKRGTVMISVKVNIYDKQKAHKLPTGIRLLVRQACKATLVYENFSETAEVKIKNNNPLYVVKNPLQKGNISKYD